jgi:hypothetical protein
MLSAMLGWIAAVAAVGIVTRIFLGYAPPNRGYRCLRRAELATVSAAAEAVFPPGGAIACSGLEAQIPDYVDRLLALAHPRPRRLMRLLFFSIEHGTAIFPAPGGLRGFRRFSSLDLAQRSAVLEAWSGSRFFLRRLVFASLRAILTLGYFAHPRVQDRLGFAPYAIATPICEADLIYPRIGAHSNEIPWTRADLAAPGPAAPIDLDAPRMARAGGDAT